MSDEPNKVADESPVETEAAALVEDQDATASASGVSSTDDVVADEVSLVADAAVDEIADDAADGDDDSVAEVAVSEDSLGDEDAAQEADEAPGDDGADDESAESNVADSDDADESAAGDEEVKMDWYILKVQSNREKSIAAALQRKIAIEGLDEYFGEVVVPVEKVTEFKGGKKKVVQRKLYPGYIVVRMHINDDTWFAVRETSGIGDFTGSGGKPTPMLPHEVARIIQTEEEETEEAPKLNINFHLGDRVKVKEGNFESFEGEVNAIDEHSGRITVMINIFGRSTPVELEYWQVELA